MKNGWMAINKAEFDFVTSSRGQELNIEGIEKHDAPKFDAIAKKRQTEIPKEHAAEQFQTTCKKFNGLIDEKRQPLIKSLGKTEDIAVSLQQKLETHTATAADLTAANSFIAKNEAARKAELAKVEKYEVEIRALKKQHEAQVKTDPHYAAYIKKTPVPFDETLKRLDALEAQLSVPTAEKLKPLLQDVAAVVQPAVSPVASTTPAAAPTPPAPTTPTSEIDPKLLNLIAQNPAFGDPALQSAVLAEMVKLTRYYTHNTDDKSDASLRDGKFDEKEYAAAAEAIAKINEKFKDNGVR
jgi:hypothetical protein